MPREFTFELSAGMPGIGKSYQNKEQAKRYLYGNPAKGIKPKKVLVVDSQDEYDYNHPTREDMREIGLYAKSIHISQVKNFTNSSYVECCRIRPYNDNGQPMSLGEIAGVLEQIMKEYRNGLLIVEDFKQFAGSSMRQDLVDRLCTFRHKADVLASLQGVGQITPIVWQNAKWLRLHKTTDSVTRHGDKFPEKIDFLNVAENMINEQYYHGNERFFLTIDLQRGFIYGPYSQEQFIKATKDYIYQNWSRTVGKIINYRNEDGSKKFTDKTGIEEVLKKFTYSYSQFSPRLQKK